MDDLIRNAAFTWLEEQTNIHGDVLPWEILHRGFDFQGERIIPIGVTGIWKPKSMELPLSITTSPESPYNDSLTPEGLLKYNYRGTDPYHGDNVRLREVMRLQKPLVYFHGIIKGKYLTTWPVYIVQDNMKDLSFTVAVDDISYLKKTGQNLVEEDTAAYYRRSYITSNILIRLHQRSFRERVLLAYHSQCALCRLRHMELLDAAHIISDKEESGEPIIKNGLALCKIHHAAFDKNIIGINPDYIVKVREDILAEIDGPMLKYGIQSLNGNKLLLPSRKIDWPDQDRLKMRYELFLKAV
jgi:putative restriction endonuclease